MKRITPEDVVDAYIATGGTPIRDEFNKGGGRLCGVAAIAEASGSQLLDDGCQYSRFFLDDGFSESYFWGFVYGFDGVTPAYRDDSTSDYTLGLVDGRDAYAAVTAHFAKSPAEQPQEQLVEAGE